MEVEKQKQEKKEKEVVVSTVVQCALHLREACITYTVYEEVQKKKNTRKRKGRKHKSNSSSSNHKNRIRRNHHFLGDGKGGTAEEQDEEKEEWGVEWREVCTDLIGFNQVDLHKPLYPSVEVNADGAVVEFI